MRFLTVAGFVAALVTLPLGAVSAMDSMHSSMDSMHGSMMMPKCAAGDPRVGVDAMHKHYMTQDQMKMKMAGMSDSQTHAMMMKNHTKMMCMSDAKAMGAMKMASKM